MVSYVISTLAELAILAIIIRAVLSWVPGVEALQPVARFFNRITDPLLEPVRRLLPPMGGLDFSPVAAILLIWVVEYILLFLFHVLGF
jgi:YggT family protein